MAANPTYIWWNGELVDWDKATVHVSDLAWSAMGGVFEGIRAYWNPDQEELFIFRLREHMERLKNSSRLVRLPIDYDVDGLMDIAVNLCRENEVREDTYIFPFVFAGPGTQRHDPTKLQPAMTMRTNPMPTHLKTGMTHRVKVSSWTRISDNVMPPRVKNISNYRNGTLASHEVKLDGYDNALLLNPQGKVAEAPGACVMMVKKNVVITPDATSGILESITRDAIIRLVEDDPSLSMEARPVDRTELYTADEVFLCGTAAEITPVVEIDRFDIGSGDIGPVTSRLEHQLFDIMHGEAESHADWVTPVYASSDADPGVLHEESGRETVRA